MTSAKMIIKQAMLAGLIIFKIGGSVITDKNRYRSFKKDVCGKIIDVISAFDNEIIITHGAGSFGHILAKKYGFPGDISDKNLRGVSEIHADVLRLNLFLTDLMIDRGLRPIQIPPVVQSNGKHIQTVPFKKFLAEGFAPVSFGDIVPKQGFAHIISADDIVLDLAKTFHPDKVIFFSDVDGIFDRDPKTSDDATLVRNLDEQISYSDVTNDVTGGMKGKVGKIKMIRKYSNTVCILNGNYPERLTRLGSDKFVGTVI